MNMTKYAFMEQERAVLYADINGIDGHEGINGSVSVYYLPDGLYFVLELSGLPQSQALPFHVHKGIICDNAGEKAAILPDVISDGLGYASGQFYTNVSELWDISGKVVMLHEKIGNEEPQIACGVLMRIL